MGKGKWAYQRLCHVLTPVRGQSSGLVSLVRGRKATTLERHLLGPVPPSPYSPVLTTTVGILGGGRRQPHTTSSNTSSSLS